MRRKYEEDEKMSSSRIFEIRNENEVSIRNIFRESTSKIKLKEPTSRRIFEDPSSNEEDEKVCFKASHEEDECEVTTLSYKQLFKLNSKLIKEYDNI